MMFTQRFLVKKAVAEATAVITVKNREFYFPADIEDIIESKIEDVIFDEIIPFRNHVVVKGGIIKKILFKAKECQSVKADSVELGFCENITIPGFIPGRIIDGHYDLSGNEIITRVNRTDIIENLKCICFCNGVWFDESGNMTDPGELNLPSELLGSIYSSIPSDHNDEEDEEKAKDNDKENRDRDKSEDEQKEKSECRFKPMIPIHKASCLQILFEEIFINVTITVLVEKQVEIEVKPKPVFECRFKGVCRQICS